MGTLMLSPPSFGFEKQGIPASNAITMFYKQIILRNGLPFEVKLPDHPLDVSRMTTEQLHAELEKGYAQMQNGQTIPAEQAFADIRRKYGV
jgi:addiction module RelB/DinJ family antitoxin